VLASAAAAAAVAATSASAQVLPPLPGPAPPAPPPITAPIFGPFFSVLAQGEGSSVSAGDLAANQADGTVPEHFTSQQPLYAGIMPKARTLLPQDIDTYYKRTTFGELPGDVQNVTEPRPGALIFRDKQFGMAHIYSDNRYDLMFATGYATAQERLFLMDALRRTAKGTLAGLTGPSAARGDADQLTDQDFSDEELTAQFETLPQRFGPEGQRVHDDILAYIDGINARIDEVNADPTQMPAEYPALGTTPAPWTISDTAALATLLVTQFTVSNGSEEVNALLQQAFKKRFGKRWRKAYKDFRTAQDPEAITVARRKFPSDNPGKVKPGLNAIPDEGSIKARDALVEGPSEGEQQQAAKNLPAWVRSINGLKKSLPTEMSNAVMVTAKLTPDGHPLAAMGPQVDYYSPQIFSEYELHGAGIDVTGVAFPGASPYPLIGHGIDFAWSGTSANGDNNDTFVEKLCNQDGSPATESSTAYMYNGACTPFIMRDQEVETPTSPVSPEPPQTIKYRTMRSVHGPVFKLGTVAGEPVAFTKAKGVDFHELDASLPFMRMAENLPTDAKSFQDAFSGFPGTENWFYVDNKSVAFLQSGLYPKHAKGSDVDLPFWGDGRADWQGFNPGAYTFDALAPERRPRALDPKEGFFISWNNKEAPGWRKGPREWGDGPVHRALILQRKLMAQKKKGGGKLDLVALTRAVNIAATTDLRAEADYMWMRRVIGKAPPEDERFLKLLDDWRQSGSQRLDADGDNLYDHSAAVALLDAWWPHAVRSQFEPALGKELFDRVEADVLGLGSFDDWSWATHVQKDLRAVLGRKVKGKYSRIYCGGPAKRPLKKKALKRVRRRCRARLLDTLHVAVGEAGSKYGSTDPAQWKVPATCEKASPPLCDQIVPTTAGAIDTPPFPWQNRGTYHQVVSLTGHR
jgi:acyl-homoserine lactone acylase PvdQ